MALLERAQNIITKPNAEWPVIAAEPTTPGVLYGSYIVPLALISPICAFLSTALFIHRSFFVAAIGAVMTFILELINVAVVALIAEALAPSFNAVKDRSQAFKLVAYSYTPRWIAGVLNLIPILGAFFILIASLYSLYLLYLGVTPVMRTPPDKAIGYTVVIVVAAIVISVVVVAVVTAVIASLAVGAAISSGAFTR